MALKFTKAEIDKVAELTERLRRVQNSIESAIGDINKKISDLSDELSSEISGYNQVIADAEGEFDEIRNRVREELDDRSEKWLESDAGFAAEAWVSSLEDIGFEQTDTTTFEEVAVPDDADSLADELEALSTEPE